MSRVSNSKQQPELSLTQQDAAVDQNRFLLNSLTPGVKLEGCDLVTLSHAKSYAPTVAERCWSPFLSFGLAVCSVSAARGVEPAVLTTVDVFFFLECVCI